MSIIYDDNDDDDNDDGIVSLCHSPLLLFVIISFCFKKIFKVTP